MTNDTVAATGPPVEVLIRRLLDTPRDVLAPPIVAGQGVVDTAAVVSDLLVDRGGTGLDSTLARGFRPAEDTPAARNWLSGVLVGAWLLADPALGADAAGDGAERILRFLVTDLGDLTGVVAAPTLVSDPDRREELARRCLGALGLVPGGETAAQAADRLSALDSVERARVLAATRDAELRAAEVRRALHSKRAAEAAAKVARE